jgi:hypothetical protein
MLELGRELEGSRIGWLGHQVSFAVNDQSHGLAAGEP